MVSVTGIAAAKNAPNETPALMIDRILTTKTIKKGATMHSVGSRAARNNHGMRADGAFTNRRNFGQGNSGAQGINTDLQ